MDAEAVFFEMIHSVICGEPVSKEVKSACTPELLEARFVFAVKHDLAHLVGQAVGELRLSGSDTQKKCKKAAVSAFGRYVRQEHEYQQVCQALEEAKICFIPLKGAVLRAYYPEPWMRNSCDIDILVKKADLHTAFSVLKEQLQYTGSGEIGDHDVALSSPGGVHLELHFDLIQERHANDGCREVLSRIWEDAIPNSPGTSQLRMSDAMFYFYHIAHMAKHFKNGGCGIRPVLDVWILNHRVAHDKTKRELLLREGGLFKFAQAMENLSEAWFSGLLVDAEAQQVSDYIFSGGIYGTTQNRAALGQAKNGGKLRYIITQRIFFPYQFLKAEYPVLEKHKWLTPVFQIVRWVRCLLRGEWKRRVGELRINKKVTEQEAKNAAELLAYLGL